MGYIPIAHQLPAGRLKNSSKQIAEVSMNVTEVLICGYNGEKPVFAANLTPGIVTAIVTDTDEQGRTVVSGIDEQATIALAPLLRLVSELAKRSQAPQAN
jgi:hypothetical protein